jgi:hypothetical protein
VRCLRYWPSRKIDHASCFERLTECSFHSPREQHSFQSKYLLMPWHERTIAQSTNTKHGYKHDCLEDNVLPQLTCAGLTLCSKRRVSDSASMCRPAGRKAAHSCYRHQQTPHSAPSSGIRQNYLIYLSLGDSSSCFWKTVTLQNYFVCPLHKIGQFIYHKISLQYHKLTHLNK